LSHRDITWQVFMYKIIQMAILSKEF